MASFGGPMTAGPAAPPPPPTSPTAPPAVFRSCTAGHPDINRNCSQMKFCRNNWPSDSANNNKKRQAASTTNCQPMLHYTILHFFLSSLQLSEDCKQMKYQPSFYPVFTDSLCHASEQMASCHCMCFHLWTINYLTCIFKEKGLQRYTERLIQPWLVLQYIL